VHAHAPARVRRVTLYHPPELRPVGVV